MIQIHSDNADNYFASSDQPGLLVISDVTSLRAERERARTAALQAAMAEEERTRSPARGPLGGDLPARRTHERDGLGGLDPAAARSVQRGSAQARPPPAASTWNPLRLVIPPSAPRWCSASISTNCCATCWKCARPPAARRRGGGLAPGRYPAALLGRPLQLRCSSRRWWITPSRPWTPKAGSAASDPRHLGGAQLHGGHRHRQRPRHPGRAAPPGLRALLLGQDGREPPPSAPACPGPSRSSRTTAASSIWTRAPAAAATWSSSSAWTATRSENNDEQNARTRDPLRGLSAPAATAAPTS